MIEIQLKNFDTHTYEAKCAMQKVSKLQELGIHHQNIAL